MGIDALESVYYYLFTELKDSRANTPLHYATQSGDREIVACLIKHGANPNAVGDRGYTPLHISVSLNSIN